MFVHMAAGMASDGLSLASGAAAVCPVGRSGVAGDVVAWLVWVVGAAGVFGVMLVTALEPIILVIPSGVILPLVGFTAAHGALNVVETVAAASVGSLAGALALYALARSVGLERLERAADVLPAVSRKDVERADVWFDRYGGWSVLIGREVPMVRALISIPAGLHRMNPFWFSLLTFVGSLVWNTVLVGAGYWLGDRWCTVNGMVDVFEDVVIAALVLLLVVFVVRRVRGRR